MLQVERFADSCKHFGKIAGNIVVKCFRNATPASKLASEKGTFTARKVLCLQVHPPLEVIEKICISEKA